MSSRDSHKTYVCGCVKISTNIINKRNKQRASDHLQRLRLSSLQLIRRKLKVLWFIVLIYENIEEIFSCFFDDFSSKLKKKWTWQTLNWHE